jgi:hypothetical protein
MSRIGGYLTSVIDPAFSGFVGDSGFITSVVPTPARTGGQFMFAPGSPLAFMPARAPDYVPVPAYAPRKKARARDPSSSPERAPTRSRMIPAELKVHAPLDVLTRAAEEGAKIGSIQMGARKKMAKK